MKIKKTKLDKKLASLTQVEQKLLTFYSDDVADTTIAKKMNLPLGVVRSKTRAALKKVR